MSQDLNRERHGITTSEPHNLVRRRADQVAEQVSVLRDATNQLKQAVQDLPVDPRATTDWESLARKVAQERDEAIRRADAAEAERDRHIGAHRRDNQRHANIVASMCERNRQLQRERDDLHAAIDELGTADE